MIKIICALCVAIASIFSFVPNIATTSASSMPIVNSINFRGTPNTGNPFVNCRRIVVQYTSNWSTINDYSNGNYIFNGVQLGGGSTTYSANTNCAFVAFWDTMPYQFYYYIGVNGGVLSSILTGSTYIYRSGISTVTHISSSEILTAVNTSYYDGALLDSSGNAYFIVQLKLPFNDITRVEIRFRTPTSTSSEYGKPLFYTFTYGIIGIGSEAVDEYYDIGYTQGYNTGVTNANNTVNTNSASYNAGYESGVTESFNVVNTSSASYTAGYSAGLNNADNFSFMSLISSVIDAPVQAFRGLLNFEILGVNVSAFVLGIFSVGLLIAVVRFLL